MKEKLDFIRKIVTEVGLIPLGKSCGKFSHVLYNGQSVFVKSFAGKYGYNLTELEKLKPRTINTIYDDLYQDFG